MARFACIAGDVVDRVIVASPSWIRDEMPARMRERYSLIVEVVTPGETAETDDAIETRDCEPGSTFFAAGRRFERPALDDDDGEGT
jgi:hypothetical protein